MELRKEKNKMPSILGWLIAGMIFGPHALNLLPQIVLEAKWYRTIIMWMQCAFGVMLGSELIWSKLKISGRALIITTLTQSLGTFALVSLAFGIVFYFSNVPVSDTLLPMTILDDVVGIVVFFTVNSLITRAASGGTIPLYMIPVRVFLPIIIGIIVGFPTGLLLKKYQKNGKNLAILLCGITVTMLIGWFVNTYLLSGMFCSYSRHRPVNRHR